jgi:hypothetical protein
MRARNYLFAILGPMTLAMIMSISVAVNSGITELVPFIPMVATVSAIAGCVLVYRMWRSIDDGQSRPSPVAAVLGLMVPVFSIYWAYRVWAGWPRAYARYAARTGQNVPPIARGAFTGMVTLGWVAPLLALPAPELLKLEDPLGWLFALGAAIAAFTALALFVSAVKTVCAGINQLGVRGAPGVAGSAGFIR